MTVSKHGTELISEGCKSYHKALYAVMQFRTQVQKIIRDAVDDRATELAAALGLGESEMECADYAYPAQFQSAFDGSEAGVGLKCEDDDWTLYYYVWVGDAERDAERSFFGAEFRLKNPSVALAKLANSSDENTEGDENHILRFAYLPADGSVDLAGLCHQVLGRWIELWTRVGGLQQLLPKPKKKKPTAQ